MEEIDSGCSPCPDIISDNFGHKKSVVFVSTVYGLIHSKLETSFNRNTQSWPMFTQCFFERIIQEGVGIYPRLAKVYAKVSDIW
jgi:hypothetical protein